MYRISLKMLLGQKAKYFSMIFGLAFASLLIASMILFEASLSFLGLGVQPPTPSWGGMLSQGREYLTSAWWLGVFPGLAIILTVLGINLFGDALRDAMDPRLKV
jgi:peptide/nickel transport system permease protein